MEITFQEPIWLLMFIFLPVLFVLHYYFFEHNKRKAMKFANFSAMKRVTGTHLITKNTSQLIIRILVLVFLILAASQPLMYREGAVSTSDYVIAIDSSASMVAEDVLPNRLTVAKQAAKAFLENLEGETNVGLITFSGVTLIKHRVSDDRRAVQDAIDDLEIELSGGTDIGTALVTASNMLAASDNTKEVILITDGSDTAGAFIEESVQTGLQYIEENNVVVHTIGIGTGRGAAGYIEEGLQAEYNRDALETIADRSGGRFFEVENTAEMSLAFREINNETIRGTVDVEFAGWFLALASLGLLFEWVLLNTKFRAIP